MDIQIIIINITHNDLTWNCLPIFLEALLYYDVASSRDKVS